MRGSPVRTWLLVGCALLLTGCTGGAPSIALHRVVGRYGLPNTAGTRTDGVRYTAATVDVPRAIVAALLATVSADGADYTFAQRTGPIAQLAPGRVMLAEGTALRRVETVTRVGAGVRVHTAPAALTDAIADGRLRWTVPVDRGLGLGVGGPGGPGVGRVDGATTGTAAGYRYALGFAPHGTSLTITARLRRASPVAVDLTAVSTVQRLTSTVDLTVRGGSVVSAAVSFAAAAERTQVTYSVGSVRALSTGGASAVTVPSTLRVPIIAGGLPFSVGVGADFSVAAGFGRLGLRVTGRSSFRFAGTGGITARDGVAHRLGQPAARGAATSAGATPHGAAGAVLGTTAPRLDVAVGWYGATPAASLEVTGTTARRVTTRSAPACDATAATLHVTAGLLAGGFERTPALPSVGVATTRSAAAAPAGCGSIAGA